MSVITRFVLLTGLLFNTYVQANETKDPGFDIINKTGKPITIRLINDLDREKAVIEKAIVQPAELNSRGKTIAANSKHAQIDITKPTLLIVYRGVDSSKTEKHMLSINASPNMKGIGTEGFFNNWQIEPRPDNVYHFKPNKTIYVTVHENGDLDPQTGPAGGWWGVTEDGYPTGNNVKKDDIIRYKKAIVNGKPLED